MPARQASSQTVVCDDTFLIIDYGKVVFESNNELSAKIFLMNAGRGVLCKVLEIRCTEFLYGKKANRKTA